MGKEERKDHIFHQFIFTTYNNNIRLSESQSGSYLDINKYTNFKKLDSWSCLNPQRRIWMRCWFVQLKLERLKKKSRKIENDLKNKNGKVYDGSRHTNRNGRKSE